MPVHSSQSGSFQHLKELIRTERARELQEQRMSEEAERNGMGKLQYGRVHENPPPIDTSRNKDKNAGNQNRGVVAFPDLLGQASSKYMEDYLLSGPPQMPMNNKYKPRLPDTNTVSIIENIYYY
jgi:hypothetical protein